MTKDLLEVRNGTVHRVGQVCPDFYLKKEQVIDYGIDWVQLQF